VGGETCGEDHLEDSGVHERITLKWIFGKWEGGMEWIDLVQDRDRRWAVVNAVMNLWVQHNVGNFLTSWGTVSFSSRSLNVRCNIFRAFDLINIVTAKPWSLTPLIVVTTCTSWLHRSLAVGAQAVCMSLCWVLQYASLSRRCPHVASSFSVAHMLQV
jgi:hypothetical protein